MRNHRMTLAAAFLAALTFTAGATAQMETAPGNANALMQQVQQMQQQMQALTQQLTEIQELAVAQNPELVTQRDEVMSMVEDHMSESGVDAVASRERIETLRGQLEGDSPSAESPEELSQQLREEQTRLQQAQSQAMQDAEIQAKIESANETLVAAMREENEETDALIEDLQKAQQEYQALMRQAMQNHGGAAHQR